MRIKIEFEPSETGYKTDIDYGMRNGIEVIETTDKYVVIYYDIDEKYVQTFDNFEDLLKKIENFYRYFHGDEIKQALLNAFKEKNVREVKIDFEDKSLSPKVGYGMRNGIEVIDADKYVVIHYTEDGDYVETFYTLKDLLKRIEEVYGDEIKQALLNAFKKVYSDKEIEELLNFPNASFNLSPKDVAFAFLFGVVDSYCYYKEKINEGGDVLPYIQCLADNLQKEDLIDKFTIDGKSFREIAGITDDKFWESVKKEYEDLRWEYLGRAIAKVLNGLLEKGLTSIDENSNLNSDEKASLLEKYKNVLEELRDVITKALNKQEPPSSDKLKRYLLELYKITGFRYNYPNDPIDYYMDYYDLLNKAGKLRLLNTFLSGIDNVLFAT